MVVIFTTLEISSAMKEPGFFLIGAPKSGTTAIATYLAEHPNIRITVPKEPHFFCTDMPNYRWVRQWDQYLKLFASAAPGEVCGEASVWYMYSSEAIHHIRAAYPQAKLIAVLRRPDEMVYSLYRHLRFGLQEDQSDFRRAWELEAQRRMGRAVPRWCRDRNTLYYRSVARYGEQLSRVVGIFPREQMEIVFYEDLASKPDVVYRRLLDFLELEHDGREYFPRINVHKTHRSAMLQLGLRWSFDQLHRLRNGIEERIGLDVSRLWVHRPITNFLALSNRKTPVKPPLEEGIRKEIISSYEKDIRLLAEIAKRDLSHWLQ